MLNFPLSEAKLPKTPIMNNSHSPSLPPQKDMSVQSLEPLTVLSTPVQMFPLAQQLPSAPCKNQPRIAIDRTQAASIVRRLFPSH